MEKFWHREPGNDAVIVFSLGWGCDYKIVQHIKPEGYDILYLYDWRSLDNSEGLAEEVMAPEYRKRFLFAWSFGVWAAERVFPDLTFDRAIAYNGTPTPVDDLYGIEPRRLDATIKGIRLGGMETFLRKAYGPYYEDLKPYLQPRSLGDNVIELENLRDMALTSKPLARKWNKAIIGSEDEIFPVENLLRYWGGLTQLLPLPHYPFADAGLITKEV